MTTHPTLSIPRAPAYQWSWRYFWAGYRDYLRECTQNPNASYPGKKPPASPKSLLGISLAAVAALLGASMAVGFLMPSAARLSAGSGIDVLGAVSVAVVALGVLVPFVLLPCLLVRKGLRFGHAMARRGWELEHGLRLPVNYKIPA